MTPITSIAFVVNANKPAAQALGERLAQACQRTGVTSRITTEYPLEPHFLEGVDACCVLGGDGTLLSTVHGSITHRVPVFGINQGKLGFLAIYSAEEAERDFEKILAGHYQIEERTALRCSTPTGEDAIALNDVVIKSPITMGLVSLRVRCNDELVTDYRADGLVFCTSTGSTAYNLSAGGPIVHPSSGVITMTPICPHTLTNRSVIFPESSQLTVDCLNESISPLITVDGSQHFHHAGTPLSIAKASTTVPLLQPMHTSHFRILRTKLMWGGEEHIDGKL
ncbi:MAG: NAD(+)/NADH kinase [Verrucomicrobiota bacterium]